MATARIVGEVGGGGGVAVNWPGLIRAPVRFLARAPAATNKKPKSKKEQAAVKASRAAAKKKKSALRSRAEEEELSPEEAKLTDSYRKLAGVGAVAPRPVLSAEEKERRDLINRAWAQFTIRRAHALQGELHRALKARNHAIGELERTHPEVVALARQQDMDAPAPISRPMPTLTPPIPNYVRPDRRREEDLT